MAITDEEALVWDEERRAAERIPPPDPTPANGDAPASPATPAPARPELTIVLTLAPGAGDDAPLRACYSVGADGAPYPVISTLRVADLAHAAARIPSRVAEAEARWLAQPALPRAVDGAAVTRPARAATEKTAPGKARATGEKARDKAAASGGDTARLAAALLQETAVATGPVPPAPVAPTLAAATVANPPTIDPQSSPPPIPSKPRTTTRRGDQLSLFG